MKDLGEASFVLGIEIHRDRSKGVLGLSQKAYIEKILKKFNMHKYSPSPAPIVKGDRYGDFKCPRNQHEIDQMKNGSMCFSCRKLTICSSMYAPWLGICYRVTWQIPEQFWNRTLKLVKKVLRYLQGTKGLMMTYRRSDSWDIQILIMREMIENPRRDMYSLSQREAISWKSSKQTVTTSSTMYDSL